LLSKYIHQNQYRPNDFRHVILPNDFWKYDNLDKESVQELTNKIAIDFASNNQQVVNIIQSSIKGKNIYISNSLYDSLSIRLTNLILKETLSISMQPRDREISQLWNIIKTEMKGVTIFRTDLKSFFESLPFEDILIDLENNNYLSFTSINHLKNIMNFTCGNGDKGLPRGLAISSTLSEFAMQEFDKNIWREMNCIYYSRYVDDIVIITEKKNLKDNVQSILPYKLELNTAKTKQVCIGDDSYIDYLGYSFNVKNITNSKIALNKLNRLKTRIVLSLKDYTHNKNFNLLIDRLRFLSGNTVLKIAGRKKPITVGIRYQYSKCNQKSILNQLKDIDTFYKKILYSRNYSLSRNLRNKLNYQQFKNLEIISFRSGYLKIITHKYSKERITKIKEVWRYE